MTNNPLDRYSNRRSRFSAIGSLMRPMTSGQIIDAGLQLYRAAGGIMLKHTALPAFFSFAGLVFLFEYVFPMFWQTNTPDSIEGQVGEAVVVILIGLFVAGPVILLGISSASGVIVKLVADMMQGAIPDPAGAVQSGRKTLKALLGLHMIELLASCWMLLLSLGLLMFSALLGPGDSVSMMSGVSAFMGTIGIMIGLLVFLWVLGRHALTAPATVLEGLRPIAAAKRSLALLKAPPNQSSGLSTLTLLFLLIPLIALLLLPGYYLSLGMAGLNVWLDDTVKIPYFGTVVSKVVQLIPLYLGVWVIVPVWCTTITILYFERRVRHEGFDIQVLARQVWRSDRTTRFEL